MCVLGPFPTFFNTYAYTQNSLLLEDIHSAQEYYPLESLVLIAVLEMSLYIFFSVIIVLDYDGSALVFPLDYILL